MTPVPIHPATITQHTAVAHGAPSGRWWRDHIPQLGIRYARIGSLVVVTVADWLAYVAAHAVQAAPDGGERVETQDDILASLGRRRVG